MASQSQEVNGDIFPDDVDGRNVYDFAEGSDSDIRLKSERILVQSCAVDCLCFPGFFFRTIREFISRTGKFVTDSFKPCTATNFRIGHAAA